MASAHQKHESDAGVELEKGELDIASLPVYLETSENICSEVAIQYKNEEHEVSHQ